MAIEKLSDADRDMRKYATEKAYKLMQDVTQFAEIAELTKSDAGACIGALFLRLAATIATNSDISKDWWLETCGKVFDDCVEVKKQNP